jgi:hypothetical protein
MRKMWISLVVSAVISTSSCTAALSDEEACSQAGKFSTETSETIRRATENLSNDQSRKRFSERLVEISEEFSALPIRNAEIADAVSEWARINRKLGFELGSFNLITATDSQKSTLREILDDALIADSRLIRVCDL